MFSSRVTHVFVRTVLARDGVWHETSGEKTDGCPRGAAGGRWIRSQKSGVQPWLQPQGPSASEQDISLFIASVSLPGKWGGKWACELWNPWATTGECASQNERSHVLQATKTWHSQINKQLKKIIKCQKDSSHKARHRAILERPLANKLWENNHRKSIICFGKTTTENQLSDEPLINHRGRYIRT